MAKNSTYHGVSEKELRDLSLKKRLTGLVDHRKLFPYHGQIRLEPDRLVLEGWQEIPRSWIVAITVGFTDVYPRSLAAGVRGQGPSLGVLSRGEPLVLHLMRGKSPIYLLAGYNWLTGMNQNRVWHQRIFKWLNSLEVA